MGFTIFSRVTLADCVSLSAALLGLAAVPMVMMGRADLAAFAMVASAGLDYLDGRVARKFGGGHEWGKNIDSLADVVSFAVAPAVLAWTVIAASLGALGSDRLLAAVIGFVFGSAIVVAGILRLARYNVSATGGFYIGMPITVNGVSFPALYFLTAGLPAVARAVIWPIACLVAAGLMVADFIIRKI